VACIDETFKSGICIDGVSGFEKVLVFFSLHCMIWDGTGLLITIGRGANGGGLVNLIKRNWMGMEWNGMDWTGADFTERRRC